MSSWLRIRDILLQTPNIDSDVQAEFDNMEEVDYRKSEINVRNFPCQNLWESNNYKWHKAGLGVFDYKYKPGKPRIPLYPDDKVVLHRTAGRKKITLRCKVVSASIQDKDEIGEAERYSSVCGRAVLECTGISID